MSLSVYCILRDIRAHEWTHEIWSVDWLLTPVQVNNGVSHCAHAGPSRFAVEFVMATRPRIVRAVIPADGRDATARAEEVEAKESDEIVDEATDPVDADFDEATYLRAFPDIAEAVRRGIL